MYTVTNISEMLGVKEYRVRECIRSGKLNSLELQAVKDGNTYKITHDALDEWLNNKKLVINYSPLNTEQCQREWDIDGWWCINDHTGCIYNNGHNTCTFFK